MSGESIRTKALGDLLELAERIFEKQPASRSVMLSVAQYWNDEADDAVHARVQVSEREMPLWPHFCADDYDGRPAVPGERCDYCDDDVGYFPFDDNGSAIDGFEAYCNEHGSQEDEFAVAYTPFAIARRDGGGVAMEIIGKPLRPEHELLDRDDSVTPLKLDERGRELFALACADPDDDAVRHVLADHLLEQGHPLGEFLILGLAGKLATKTAMRYYEILVEHMRSWMHPLDRVIPIGCARFERGLLSHADVFIDGVDPVRGARAWNSVEVLRFLPGSTEYLDPAMIALRDVGPLHDLEQLVGAPRPWAIQHLHVCVLDAAKLDQLVGTPNLPRLRTLTFTPDGDLPAALEVLSRAPWWSQLERVTALGDGAREMLAKHGAPSHPRAWFAAGERDSPDRAVGWQLAYGPEHTVEVTMSGWHPTATRERLVELLAGERRPITLARSPFWHPTDADAELLRAAGFVVVS